MLIYWSNKALCLDIRVVDDMASLFHRAATMDDKQVNILANSPPSISETSNEGHVADWSEDEEKKLVRKYITPA